MMVLQKDNDTLPPASVLDLFPRLQSSRAIFLDKTDVVIHAPGFEDRTMAVTNTVSTDGGSTAILLDYLPFNLNNRLRDVRDALIASRVEVREEDILSYNRFEPDNF